MIESGVRMGRYIKKKKIGIDVTHPHLLKEWDFKLNKDVDMSQTTFGSRTAVWWHCLKCERHWDATPNTRISNNNGCPYCSGVRVSELNSLEHNLPELLIDWSYELNTIKPSEVSIGSDIKRWWDCHRCEYKWEATINHKKNLIVGCPNCIGSVLNDTNNLLFCNPILCEEWDYEKNKLRPENYFSKSSQSVSWKCKKCSHSFVAVISNRNKDNGTGCPKCTARRQTSFGEQALRYYLLKIFKNTENRKKLAFRNQKIEADILIVDLKIIIEYDGLRYHKEKRREDTLKNMKFNSLGYKVLRLREEGLDECFGSKNFFLDGADTKNIDNPIKEIFEYISTIRDIGLSETHLDKLKNIDINTNRDRVEILELMELPDVNNNLSTRFPEIASEWDCTKNGNLTPEMFTYGSKIIINWICKENHSFEYSINERTNNGRSCKTCNKSRYISKNSFGEKFPESNEEWCFDLNEGITPFDIITHSKDKFWFNTSRGIKHTTASSRTGVYRARRKANNK